MLDIKFIRENKDIVIAGAKKKRIEVDIEQLLKVDDKRRELQASFDANRAQQNAASDKIAQASPEERQTLIAQMQRI
jgi:seryl-tRNA synthetase